MKAWGSNGSRTLGLDQKRPVVTSTLVAGLADVKQLAAGAMHSCALLRG